MDKDSVMGRYQVEAADKFRVHFVSFSNTKDPTAYSTLSPGQVPSPWQIKVLEDYLRKIKLESFI